MLNITRKSGEAIMVRKDIRVTFVRLVRDLALLKIDAPKRAGARCGRLNLRVGQAAFVMDEVRLFLLRIQGPDLVRLGVDAPREVEIYREEIFWRRQSERRP